MAEGLDDDRKRNIVRSLIDFAATELELELSPFRAEAIVDHVAGEVGPARYNQAIQDARACLAGKLEDLDIELTLPETPKGRRD